MFFVFGVGTFFDFFLKGILTLPLLLQGTLSFGLLVFDCILIFMVPVLLRLVVFEVPVLLTLLLYFE